ncbi:MAG: zinc-dependent peptidase [Syntrophales bacterium]|jgi:Mlc titration factor MtfA (ptsG expression regulator)|nr:zinc-dependent peptidase [Syntrophales bacterium]
MTYFWVFIAIIVTIAAFFIKVRRLYVEKRRRRIQSAPFPDAWEKILARNVSLYRRVPPILKEGLRNNIKLFLAEKRFEGCGGLAITDEIRLTIAGQACLLQMNKPFKNFPGLTAILVYPGMYLVSGKTYIGGGAFLEGEELRAGESWTRGVVILAWDQVKKESFRSIGSKNVVLHEFAHQLDQEDGIANGAPILSTRFLYKSWAATFEKEYRKLIKETALQREYLFNEYGASNPAEFFAVATETFYKKPLEMKAGAPSLYKELKEYYCVDPAVWTEPENGSEQM